MKLRNTSSQRNGDSDVATAHIHQLLRDLVSERDSGGRCGETGTDDSQAS
jgi:hypothetical protein